MRLYSYGLFLRKQLTLPCFHRGRAAETSLAGVVTPGGSIRCSSSCSRRFRFREVHVEVRVSLVWLQLGSDESKVETTFIRERAWSYFIRSKRIARPVPKRFSTTLCRPTRASQVNQPSTEVLIGLCTPRSVPHKLWSVEIPYFDSQFLVLTVTALNVDSLTL